VQLMYTAKDARAHHELYFSLIRDAMKIAPSMWAHIESINNHILSGEMYKAMKDAKRLVAHERDVLNYGARNKGVRGDREANSNPA
jgi:flagellar biosynthesis repressor protein FlbT